MALGLADGNLKGRELCNQLRAVILDNFRFTPTPSPFFSRHPRFVEFYQVVKLEMPNNETNELLVLIREGSARARIKATRDALTPAELKIRARLCLRASRRYERSGRLYASAVLRGMARGYRAVAGEPPLGLHRR